MIRYSVLSCHLTDQIIDGQQQGNDDDGEKGTGHDEHEGFQHFSQGGHQDVQLFAVLLGDVIKLLGERTTHLAEIDHAHHKGRKDIRPFKRVRNAISFGNRFFDLDEFVTIDLIAHRLENNLE